MKGDIKVINFKCQSTEDVNEHHSAQLMSYVKFAKYQRGQCLKSVKLAVNDTKEIRVNDDTFTAEEVEEIIEAVHESVTSEVETELINSAHTNILLLKQLFTQAEKWHLNLDTDMSELENRYDVISTLSAFSIYFTFIFFKIQRSSRRCEKMGRTRTFWVQGQFKRIFEEKFS